MEPVNFLYSICLGVIHLIKSIRINYFGKLPYVHRITLMFSIHIFNIIHILLSIYTQDSGLQCVGLNHFGG